MVLRGEATRFRFLVGIHADIPTYFRTRQAFHCLKHAKCVKSGSQRSAQNVYTVTEERISQKDSVGVYVFGE